jgi:hypothetical protein
VVCDAADKKGAHRQTLDVHSCFVPLLAWVLSAWPPSEKRLALAMDATSLGQLFAVLAISVVHRGCAIPVAWVVLPGNTPGAWKTHWLSLLQQFHGSVPADWTVLVLADRGLYAAWLYRQIVSLGWHPYLRINAGGLFRPAAQPTFRPLTTVVPSVGSAWSGRVACFKSRPLLCTLLAAWAASYTDPWLILTDLAPEQADVCWYSLRAWIEIVFTQMTKGCLFACWCGRDDVADFHLGVVNDDSVNQQLYQLSALGEIELLECRLQAPTEIADAGGELGAVQLLLGLRLQLTQLLRQAILRLGDLLPLALELIPADHFGQVHLEQAGLLARQLCQSGPQGMLTILQRLREPLTRLGACQLMGDEGRICQ